jgi:hypothetical protein
MIGKSGILKISAALVAVAVLAVGIFSIFSSDNDASTTIEAPQHAQSEMILLEDGTEVGTVFIWSEDLEVLFVKYVMDEGWEMTGSQLTFGTSLADIYQRNGIPVPERFLYTQDHDPSVTDYLYKFDIREEYSKEDVLYLASHSIILNTTDSSKKGQEMAGWVGTNHFHGSGHASYFVYKFSTEEIWPPSGTASFGFEDLPMRLDDTGIYSKNDWDFNDLVFDVKIKTSYIENKLTWIEWTFEAEESSAQHSHLLNLFIESNTFKSNGTYEISYFRNEGNEIISQTGVMDFIYSENLDVGIFLNENTSHAVKQEQTTHIRIDFEEGFGFDLSHFGYNELDAHATGLFFDPYLHNLGTREDISIGDSRIVFVPEDWEWPVPDETPIWEIYPYDFLTGNGVYHDKEVNEPIFVGEWYSV